MHAAPKSAFSRSVFQDWPFSYPNLLRACHREDGIASSLIENLERSGIEDLHSSDHSVLKFIDDLAASSRLFRAKIPGTSLGFEDLLKVSFENSDSEKDINGERSVFLVQLALLQLKEEGLIKNCVYADSPLRNHLRDLDIPFEKLNFLDALGVDFLVEIEHGYFLPIQVKSSAQNQDSRIVSLKVDYNVLSALESSIEGLSSNIFAAGPRVHVQRDIPFQSKLNDLSLRELIEDIKDKLDPSSLNKSMLLHFPDGIIKASNFEILMEMYNKAYLQFPSRKEVIEDLSNASKVNVKENSSLDEASIAQEEFDFKAEFVATIKGEDTDYPTVQEVIKDFIAKNPVHNKEQVDLVRKKLEQIFSTEPVSKACIRKLDGEYEKLKPHNSMLDIFENPDSLLELKLDLTLALLLDKGRIDEYIFPESLTISESSDDKILPFALVKIGRFTKPLKIYQDISKTPHVNYRELTEAKRKRVAALFPEDLSNSLAKHELNRHPLFVLINNLRYQTLNDIQKMLGNSLPERQNFGTHRSPKA